MPAQARWIRRMAPVLIGVFLLAPAATAAERNPAAFLTTPAEPLRVVWYPEEPYALDGHGVPTGFEIDLWRMIAERSGLAYQIRKASTFDALLKSVSSGEADVAIGAILINENRAKRFRYSLPTASSSLKLYALAPKEFTALKVLRVITSKGVLLIFLGLVLIACFFAVPVWLLERNRAEFGNQTVRGQLIFVIQKTLLLSSDHTSQSKTRLISIASLFARVLLTAYFTSYILRVVTMDASVRGHSMLVQLDHKSLKGRKFGALASSVQAAVLRSNGADVVTCEMTRECLDWLREGKIAAILSDDRTMRSAIKEMPPEPKIVAVSGNLMSLFMAYGFSRRFSEDPRAGLINESIARSYYDGTHAALARTWLDP